MEFDGVDGGEQESYASMRHIARQDIIGCAADGLEPGDALNWRAAVKRHPFFSEVTNAAQQQGEELGKVLGTAVGILSSLLRLSEAPAGSDEELPSDVTEGRNMAQSLLQQLRVLIALYQSSPVPTRRALKRAIGEQRGENGEYAQKSKDGSSDESSDDEGDDDGSATAENLRVAIHTTVHEIKRGTLKNCFKSWGSGVGGSATRKAAFHILESFVDQNRPTAAGNGGAAPQQRLDDW
jgi:hypothetical protein